jgi:CDP-6-deoxy-D-xylo-4-hexulose-3-dehydrase
MEEFSDRIVLPRLDERSEPAWFGFPITMRGRSKRELVQWLQQANIDTRELFAGSILRQPGYRRAAIRVHGELPETERMLRESLFLGVYPGLSDEMVDFMIDRLRGFLRRLS